MVFVSVVTRSEQW